MKGSRAKSPVTGSSLEPGKTRVLTRAALFLLALVVVGVSSALAFVLGAVIAPGLPFPEAAQLVVVRARKTNGAPTTLTRAEAAFLAQGGFFRGAFAFRDAQLSVGGTSGRLAVSGLFVEPGFLAVLGLQPRLGRDFLAEENRGGGPSVCLVSEKFWKTELGADPGVVGTKLLVSGKPLTVVGVVPEAVATVGLLDADVFLPEAQDPDNQRPPNALRNRYFLARLGEKRGTNVFGGFVADLARQERGLQPPGEEQTRLEVAQLRDLLTAAYRRFLPVVVGSSALVWLLAAASLGFTASLALAGRQGEAAVRLACGGGRWAVAQDLVRPIQQPLLAGGGVGLGLGAGLGRLLADVAELRRFESGHSWIFLLSVGCGLLTVFLAIAYLLAWRFAAPRLCDSLYRGGFGNRPVALRASKVKALILTQGSVGGSLLLFFFCSHLVLLKLSQAERNLPLSRLGLAFAVVDSARGRADLYEVYERLLAGAQRVPGVVAATLSSGLPDLGGEEKISVFPAAGGSTGQEVRSFHVWPGFFSSLGLRLVWGREFTTGDTADSTPVVMLSRGLAERLCEAPGRVACFIAVGRHQRRALVVGAVDELPSIRSGGERIPSIYIPLTQDPRGGFWIVTVFAKRPGPLADLSGMLRASDPRVTVWPSVAGENVVTRAKRGPRVRRLFLVVLSSCGLFLAFIGGMAFTAFFAFERHPEWWIRRALGAQPKHLAEAFFGYAGKHWIAGLVLGVGIAGLPLLLRGTAILLGVHVNLSAAATLALASGLTLAALTLWPSFWLVRRLSEDQPR